MIRIVIDTNVYVSALVFGGNPAAVLRLAEAKGMQLATAEAIRAELEETLTAKFGWTSDRARAACEVIWETAEWIHPGKVYRGSRDPDDDHVLACAVEAGAQIIVTGDNDLLSLGSFREIEIITPAEFMRQYGRRDS